jgi:hypothetical protein
MTARPPRRRDPATRREIIANWLALLALLALGIVWPGEEAPGPATHSAHTLRPPAAAGAVAVRALPARNIREITRTQPACARKVALG